MNYKKITLALVVITLAFSMGFVTYKGAEFLKNFVLGTGSDCSQKVDPRNCARQQENSLRRDLNRR
ncbi:MAG: hypothetical protein DWQ47_01660 [Acidobacteria bacterium]|nr:MAG: hypothetical protein DWQ32_12120 [Acidobacteriota bacterium]REK04202.1 MAG: hypothetical protein DWQ38_01645 [Acidobacteriota bacterium]REK15364.1 MAG: hypothetical protein DWQ43_17810 [Acidobacteriota bacterium]REK46454.1 MAG: hypothetical protein DWQ47_01660 [Acidobacteriota bacterium]